MHFLENLSVFKNLFSSASAQKYMDVYVDTRIESLRLTYVHLKNL